MRHCLLQVILALCLVSQCSSNLIKHYYIVSVNSADSTCQGYQNGTCLTLKQLAQSNLTSTGGTNFTLSFLPGNHLLVQSLAIRNLTHIQINGINKSIIEFHEDNKIEISHSVTLCINDIVFVRHQYMRHELTDYRNWEQLLSINNVKIIHINNCCFMSSKNLQNYNQETSCG